MADDFKEERRRKRLDSVEAKREQRKNPTLRRENAVGLGIKRNKPQSALAPEPAQQSKQNNTQPAPQQQENKNYFLLLKKDRLEISEEARRRYQEECHK